jgi:hypothetical protein
MSIPRKRSRKIVVDGKPFIYLVKETTIPEHRDQKELSVTVQEDVERPGNVLSFRAFYGQPITSPVITEVVRLALAKGWKPEKRGGAFTLDPWAK